MHFQNKFLCFHACQQPKILFSGIDLSITETKATQTTGVSVIDPE